MTTKKLYLFLGVALLLLSSCSNQGSAQLTVNSVGFRIGTIEGFSTSKMVFYPEVQTGGQCFLQYLEWSAYVGCWDDAVTQINITDAAFHSTSGNILGARIAIDPSKANGEHWIAAFTLFGGFAHQFISPTYVAGSNEFTGTEYMGPNGINSYEIGISAYTRIFDTIELRAQVQQLFAISVVSRRISGSAGLNYVF